ncbi:MAG: YceI family protein [Flavobacteriales bacterium]|nr:YceI family protein [Flavobacteriales bacterium]
MNMHALSTAAMAALLLTACGGGEEAGTMTDETAGSETTTTSSPVTYAVDTEASRVMWRGVMLGVKEHSGNLKFKPGSTIQVQDGKVVGGELIVDMTTMEATDDWTYTEDYSREKLVGHLSSDDFFAVSSHPEAKLTLGEQSGMEVPGNLTVRGETSTETVTDVSVRGNEQVMKASGKLTFDRQKYNVAWSTGAQDMVLSDDIELTVELKADAK